MSKKSKKSKKSAKRTKANRLNAQKSTGPVTEAGKAVSSQNAAKHHLFSQKILLPHESAEAYQKFYAEMMADLAPVGEHERIFAERYINDLWRSQRILEYEARIYQEFDGKPELAAKLELLSRTQSRLDNRIFRARKELRNLQTERRLKELRQRTAKPYATPTERQIPQVYEKPETQTASDVSAQPESTMASFCAPPSSTTPPPPNMKERLAIPYLEEAHL